MNTSIISKLAKLLKVSDRRVFEVMIKARRAHPREPRTQIRHVILVLSKSGKDAQKLIDALGVTRHVRPGLGKLAWRIRDEYQRAVEQLGPDLSGCDPMDVLTSAMPDVDERDLLDATILSGVVLRHGVETQLLRDEEE